MKYLLLLLALVSGTAWAQRTNFVVVERDAFCSHTNHNLVFTARPKFESVRVEWRPVDDITQHCSNPHSTACAFVKTVGDETVCTVYTKQTLNLAILGHEVRHCFELDWHR
jgi:hypothetical protein